MSYARIDSPTPAIMNFFKPTHPSSSQPMTPVRRKKLVFSYAPDWILTIVLAALFFSLDKVEGYRRRFSLTDVSIRYPFAEHERVPNLALYMIAFVAPFCIMPLVNFLTVRSLWDFHNSTLGLILGLAITGSFTQVVKITVGRPRPDFLSRCQPPPDLTDPPYGLSDWTICSQTDNHIMRDGFRSFFSGHSSLSFAGMGFLAFYLAGKLHLFDSRGHTGKAWLALSPFMAAALVAISRTMDSRHHWHDVLVGSLVGTLFSFFSYRQYYPALESPQSHRPYSPRIKREGDHNVLPLHNHVLHNPIHAPSPFTHQKVGAHEGTALQRPTHSSSSSVDDGEYELSGTVPRPVPPQVHEGWRDVDGEAESTLPQANTISTAQAHRSSPSPVGRTAQVESQL